MVMKASSLTVIRSFKTNFTRLAIIISIIAIGVGLSTGLGAISHVLGHSINNSLLVSNYPDINVKAISQNGINPSDFDDIITNDKVIAIDYFTMLDDESTRIYYIDFLNQKSNTLTLLDGRMPQSDNEILIEESSDFMLSIVLGDLLTYQHREYIVVGIVRNSMYLVKDRITNIQNDSISIDTIIYFDSNYNSFPIYTDAFILLSHDYYIFSDSYIDYVDEFIHESSSVLDQVEYIILTHNSMQTPAYINSYMDKLDVISLIFPVFFILVISIVVHTTMKRLIENERIIIGTYISLGFSNNKIKSKYNIIALLTGIIGSIIGIITGHYILTTLIYQAFNAMFYMPDMINSFYVQNGLITSFVIICIMLLTVSLITKRTLKSNPASLLRSKSPRNGGKIFLESIPLVWNKLKFKYKSSLRNVLRYKSHFFMTVLSVMGSTALVFAGFGLYENTLADSVLMVSSIKLIAIIIIITAALLSILVTYNLTNMNIEERTREIATLKVLGYNNIEVSGYIFREVLIIASIGILLGLPIGYYFVDLVFIYLEFGSINDVTFVTWIMTLFLSFGFIIITDALLYTKIIKVDMNESLKTID